MEAALLLVTLIAIGSVYLGVRLLLATWRRPPAPASALPAATIANPPAATAVARQAATGAIWIVETVARAAATVTGLVLVGWPLAALVVLVAAGRTH